MRIIKVSYGETFNTGNFTSQRYDMEAELENGEHPYMALQELRASVRGAFQSREQEWEYDPALNPPGTVRLKSQQEASEWPPFPKYEQGEGEPDDDYPPF